MTSNSTPSPRHTREHLLLDIRGLVHMHHSGALGGEAMPEDQNPGLRTDSSESYLFFTLPMALNYQRNSYSLWKAATSTYQDDATRFVFFPHTVVNVPDSELRAALLKYKVALQPNKHVATWKRICNTLVEKFNGDVRVLLSSGGFQIPIIKSILQSTDKAGFPYLSGPKICNYWLYVISQYTDAKLLGREELSIAPDTHVIQATAKLGLVNLEGVSEMALRRDVARIWQDILQDTEYAPIDLHTPLWLWSRAGFPPIRRPE